MEDIVINGVSVNKLKKQRAAMRPGVSKIIAESIAKAQELVDELLELDDKVVIDLKAQEAFELLETAELLSSVSGVSFFLPYYEEYGHYEFSDTISGKLEDSENTLCRPDWKEEDSLYRLARKAELMESEVKGWHSSTC